MEILTEEGIFAIGLWEWMQQKEDVPGIRDITAEVGIHAAWVQETVNTSTWLR